MSDYYRGNNSEGEEVDQKKNQHKDGSDEEEEEDKEVKKVWIEEEVKGAFLDEARQNLMNSPLSKFTTFSTGCQGGFHKQCSTEELEELKYNVESTTFKVLLRLLLKLWCTSSTVENRPVNSGRTGRVEFGIK